MEAIFNNLISKNIYRFFHGKAIMKKVMERFSTNLVYGIH